MHACTPCAPTGRVPCRGSKGWHTCSPPGAHAMAPRSAFKASLAWLPPPSRPAPGPCATAPAAASSPPPPAARHATHSAPVRLCFPLLLEMSSPYEEATMRICPLAMGFCTSVWSSCGIVISSCCCGHCRSRCCRCCVAGAGQLAEELMNLGVAAKNTAKCLKSRQQHAGKPGARSLQQDAPTLPSTAP